ncbi:hypothetical protein [Bordetella genomosp. 4]|uniref:HPt domain-containing protein n=1 Tax=Bordetella genomosp. 4 TaxID=463044 RepID=A0A261U4E5_9BORD|nr:hypothetical protein [Bordetella genomosp. 4]OZI56824.1 hypothetical protein CAL20_15635 [Bordetella genomosp. 4]
MLHIDTVLSLYPDDAARLLLLSQAMAQTQADLTSLRDAINTGNRKAALDHTHKAKGTASFLGADKQALQHFDQLTQALKNADGKQSDTTTHRHPAGQPHHCEPTNHPALLAPMPATVRHSFIAVESILQDLEVSIQTRIKALKNKQTRSRNA